VGTFFRWTTSALSEVFVQMKTFRCIRRAVLIVAVAVPLVACGSKGGGDSGAPVGTVPADTSVETVPADSPSAEPTGPETPRPKESGDVAISVPSLPVGGGSTQIGQPKQCVSANWLGRPAVPAGVSVQVTDVLADPRDVFELGGGCDDSPGCRSSFAFTSTQTSCAIAVTAKQNRGRQATLSLVGKVRCAASNRTCVDFARKAKGNSQLSPITQPKDDPSSEGSPTSGAG
jgi:hypothetical protein